MIKILEKLAKYFRATPRPIYNPYDYPHVKYSTIDLIESDTTGDLITDYNGIKSRLKRRAGQVKIFSW